MGRRIAFCILIVVLTPRPFGASDNSKFALSVGLKDRYNPDFKICTAVAIHTPLKIEWTQGKVKSRITGMLGEPKGDTYSLSLTIDEGVDDPPEYSESTVLKLTLEKPDKSESVVSSLFNDIHEESVLLTQKGCN
jgi:hypothetical protein